MCDPRMSRTAPITAVREVARSSPDWRMRPIKRRWSGQHNPTGARASGSRWRRWQVMPGPRARCRPRIPSGLKDGAVEPKDGVNAGYRDGYGWVSLKRCECRGRRRTDLLLGCLVLEAGPGKTGRPEFQGGCWKRDHGARASAPPDRRSQRTCTGCSPVRRTRHMCRTLSCGPRTSRLR